ncbi:MAG: Holliday junction resolvase RuvX [Planctomycetota bacterium]
MPGVLAIDYGEKKSGFAAADPLRIAVRPLETARVAGEELLAHVAHLLAERDVDTVLVGIPLEPDGSEGEGAAAVRAFVARLRARFPTLAVCVHDERLTTKEAESLLRAEGFRGREIASRRDSWSALVLLRDWIAAGEPRGPDPR